MKQKVGNKSSLTVTVTYDHVAIEFDLYGHDCEKMIATTHVDLEFDL